MTLSIILIIISYLIGSFSSAVIICRIMGYPDPRTQGSGNPGATNVLRYGGKKAAALTLLLDVLKGTIPVLIAYSLINNATTLAAVGFAAFLGHLYPIFFRFRGGKGVATAFGVLLGLSWLVAIMALATWLITAALLRYSSLAALITAILTPAYMFWLSPQPAFIVLSGIITLLLIWRHRSNIRKLLDGTEGKITFSRSQSLS